MNTQRISERELAAMTPYEAAAYWVLRADGDQMGPEDQEALNAWLSKSAMHQRAFRKAQLMWRNVEPSMDEAELRMLRVAALAVSPPPRVWLRAGAIAATFIVAAVLGAIAWQAWSTRQPPVAAVAAAATGGQSYATGHNQRSIITLADGTSVSMNLDTAFSVNLSGRERQIHLERGEAFFEVAKDPQRPFIVTAGDRNIRALGTQFNVRLDTNEVEVVLVEGKVSVDKSTPPTLADTLTHEPRKVEMTPGQRFVASIGGTSGGLTTTNAARATSWRDGWLEFEDETVGDAVAELNRYSDQPIRVTNERVKQMRFSGAFRVGQPDRFVSILQELLPISVEHGSQGETVLVARPETQTPTR
jgi:transmembrane sensor